jgi:hypothetical protein
MSNYKRGTIFRDTKYGRQAGFHCQKRRQAGRKLKQIRLDAAHVTAKCSLLNGKLQAIMI